MSVTVVMDVIKKEPEVDPLAIHWSDDTDKDEKKPLLQEGNLFDFHVAGIKTESVDYSYDLTSETKVEEPAVPTDFLSIECKAEVNDKLNEDIDSIVTWTKNLHLKINRGKTQAIILGHKRQTDAVKHLDISSIKVESCDVGAVEGNRMPHPLKCYGCGKDFWDLEELNIHIRVHKDEKPLKCDACEECFTTPAELNKHARKHRREKTFKCDVCGRCFSRCSHLKTHVRTHTGEKPFMCDECQMCFSRSDHLKKHVRVHSGNKPFKCDICEKRFSQSYRLKLHARIHTGEKPFKCDGCEMSFSRPDHLKRHARLHTGETI
ncbi:hypothetical protein ANN_27883 [Periplaneta americana]|uniref:C2H2-type domain-containing protein n=1 Tax=Periplaneta americana TaxID=6978 RepID=A0ABQ8RVN8_PERAM|nr:hypothetical protein ANN_27883 [Periplaneta americana]